jgi:hypothetical protein
MTETRTVSWVHSETSVMYSRQGLHLFVEVPQVLKLERCSASARLRLSSDHGLVAWCCACRLLLLLWGALDAAEPFLAAAAPSGPATHYYFFQELRQHKR